MNGGQGQGQDGGRQRPFSGMNRQLVPGLRALTVAETEQYRYEQPKAGEGRRGGVGVVRIAGTRDVNWFAVRLNDLQDINCPIHGSPMGINKKDGLSDYNLPETVFYRCHVNIAAPGYPAVSCGYNIYPEYDRNEAELVMQNDDIDFLEWSYKANNL